MNKHQSPGKQRGMVHFCVGAGNTYIINKQKHSGAPPKVLLLPWLAESDPRFFVRNGELIKPYTVIEFALQRTESCPELDHDRACYTETRRIEFDPKGCVPIKYFDISKLEEQLNAAQATVEKTFPDEPKGSV